MIDDKSTKTIADIRDLEGDENPYAPPGLIEETAELTNLTSREYIVLFVLALLPGWLFGMAAWQEWERFLAATPIRDVLYVACGVVFYAGLIGLWLKKAWALWLHTVFWTLLICMNLKALWPFYYYSTRSIRPVEYSTWQFAEYYFSSILMCSIFLLPNVLTLMIHRRRRKKSGHVEIN